MERHDILAMMAELKLLGMRLAFDEVLTNGVKRQHPAQQIIGDLLAAEIAEKHARSIRYQVGAAKLPLAKELADFDFRGSPINEGLVRELAVGTFLRQQRNAMRWSRPFGQLCGRDKLGSGCCQAASFSVSVPSAACVPLVLYASSGVRPARVEWGRRVL